MCRIRYIFSGVLAIIITAFFSGCRPRAFKTEFPEKVDIIKELIQEETPVLDGSLIYNPDIIMQLFEKSEDLLSTIWERRENIDQMLFAIRNVNMDGLHPEDYHLSAIEKLAQKIISSENVDIDDVAKLELLLTDSFLLLTAHLAGGKTDRETIDPQWRATGRLVRMDLVKFIDSTLQNNCIIEGLQNLTPKHREYNNLKKALLKYRQIEQSGGWEAFSTLLPKLEEGMRHPDVVLLRKRLAITQGLVNYDIEDEELFDLELYEHVMLFQLRNGLTADGVVGKATIEAMNIPVENRIASIEANLERWRWLSDDLGDRYIKVNIANFELQVIENDIMVFNTDAIVGRTYRKTPVFSAIMTYLVLNPDWTVPPTILNNDIIPAMIKNPAYLTEKNLKILGNDGTEVNPSSVDWNSVKISDFPFRVHQAPGPNNALGRIKFMFPNNYSVYIHDTPNRNLFQRTDRSFSSGCIRVDNPQELAAWLMKDNPEWGLAQIKKVIEQGKGRIVNLPNPVHVHILYLTAWASDDGVVHFRKDIYNRDKPLLTALTRVPQ